MAHPREISEMRSQIELALSRCDQDELLTGFGDGVFTQPETEPRDKVYELGKALGNLAASTGVIQ